MRMRRRAGQYANWRVILWLQLFLVAIMSLSGFYMAKWVVRKEVFLIDLILFLAALAIAIAASRKVDQWAKGRDAERVVGDTLDAALVADKRCAVAHGASIEGGKPGNIDHLVATPGKCWVVETKHGRVPKRRFRETLQRIAGNMKAMRSCSPPGTEVKGCLVFAAREEMETRPPYQSEKEEIVLLGRKELHRKLREATNVEARGDDGALAKMVWKLAGMESEEVRVSGKQDNKGDPVHVRRRAESHTLLKTMLWSFSCFVAASLCIGFVVGMWAPTGEPSLLYRVFLPVALAAAIIAAIFSGRKIQRPEGKEWQAKRVVGDTLDAALIRANKCCAVAHGVFVEGEKLGDIDHLAATPGKIAWVVETKYRRVSRGRFSETLRRIAGNMEAIRRLSSSGTEVLGRLVLATEEERKEYQYGEEKIVALGVKELYREVHKAAGADAKDDDGALAKMVWGLAGEEV